MDFPLQFAEIDHIFGPKRGTFFSILEAFSFDTRHSMEHRITTER